MYATLIAAVLVAIDHATPHFLVAAPDTETARSLGDQAERLRVRVLHTLGVRHDPAPPGHRVPILVDPTGETWGVTRSRRVAGRRAQVRVEVHGPIAAIRADTLPHEVTHVVLAQAFGVVPRWADEGLATLAEASAADVEAAGRGMPSWDLLAAEGYPDDVMGFYGDATSMTRFLLGRGDARRLVRFAQDVGRLGIDRAARVHYGFADVVELDRCWLSWRRRPR